MRISSLEEKDLSDLERVAETALEEASASLKQKVKLTLRAKEFCHELPDVTVRSLSENSP
jgi:hypothetical protein